MPIKLINNSEIVFFIFKLCPFGALELRRRELQMG